MTKTVTMLQPWTPRKPVTIDTRDTETMSLETLHLMLTYMRPDNSNAERAFIERFLTPLGVEKDGYGNLHRIVGNSPEILWSSHTDTVHKKSGAQKIEVSEDGWIFSNADCLGADCTAGVWIMAEMIKRNVPGRYVFHRAEECGGRGSSWIRKNTPEIFDGIKAAIAFDRFGFTSIITHQSMDRCCSDVFGKSLAKQLSPKFELDDGGTFTDTANYTDHVGECTNVSVGYLDQHTKRETQHGPYLAWLLDRMSELKTSALTFERKPGEIDPDSWHYHHDSKFSHFELEYSESANRYYSKTQKEYDLRGLSERLREDMVDTILNCPEAAADLLLDMGYRADDIIDFAYGAKSKGKV